MFRRRSLRAPWPVSFVYRGQQHLIHMPFPPVAGDGIKWSPNYPEMRVVRRWWSKGDFGWYLALDVEERP